MKTNVCVLGAGVVGLSIAAECKRRGLSVTILEKLPPRRDGCSFGNAGMVVPSHFIPLAAPGMVWLGLKWMWNPESPFHIKPRPDPALLSWAFRFWRSATRAHVERCAPLIRDLSLASRAHYAELAAHADFGWTPEGLLMLCKTAHGLDEEAATARRARELGIPAEVLDARALAALEPDVTLDVQGAVRFPLDGHLAPERYLAWLEQQVAGDIRWNTEVTGWRREQGRLAAVTTAKGEIRADEFVLATGIWSAATAADLGLRLPLQAGKGYSLTLPEPIEKPRHCAILTEARVAITPLGNALRVGGTMELSGMSETINPRRIRGIVRAMPRYFPRFEERHFDGITPWSGMRPCSPDGMPYLGRSRSAPNLVVAAGHAMMGLSLAPVTAEITADLLEAKSPRFNLSLLSPDRHN